MPAPRAKDEYLTEAIAKPGVGYGSVQDPVRLLERGKVGAFAKEGLAKRKEPMSS